MQHETAHSRETQITLDGGAYWDYGYDAMGQVTSGVKKDSGGTALPGYTFGYGFDTIGLRRGNRRKNGVFPRLTGVSRLATAGQVGNRETATRESQTHDYWTNALNQITAIEYQGYHHVLGSADSVATVTVDGLATQRSNSLFYGSVSGANTYEQFEIRGVLAAAGDGGTDAVSVIDAAAYIPESSNTFSHDASGNLTEDAEWLYTWDAENRLVQMETRPSVVTAGAPHRRLTFEYDSQSRRTRKTVETWDTASSSFIIHTSSLFLWNDWLLSAELEADTFEPIRSYTWGLDLAGTREQTGGVGGLALVKHHKNGEVTVPLYTTNGNIRGYWEIDADELVAEFEYGPFGELVRGTGEKAGKHPIRWSTKYEDAETGLVYYGYRFFDSETGRWLNRDPIEEQGGLNLYGFVDGSPITHFDLLGNITVSLKFAAFIPQSIGSPIQGTPSSLAGIQWFDEPGPGSRYTGTDTRESAGEAGTSRIFSVTTLIWPSLIGRMEEIGLPGITTDSNESHRISVRNGRFVTGSDQTRTSTPDVEKEEIRDVGPCESIITLHVNGIYPWPPIPGTSFLMPDIDYQIEWRIERSSTTAEEVKVTVTGWHNEFPAYEAIGNSTVIHSFSPPAGSAPGFGNLGRRHDIPEGRTHTFK